MNPRVSICLPNLNTRPFLPARLESIYRQSFEDWELVVFDNHSEDGAWEFFEAEARREPRMRIAQAPRKGLYENWNNCVRVARGEYVYIATSDDTMAPDFLERTVEALDAHPQCDLAHARLRVVDENGRDHAAMNQWWAEKSVFAQSSGEFMNLPHVRKAPFDGMLHLAGQTVYISITQLLIRRSLFGKVGMFESRWGSIGDFAWDMRAGLVTDTVHVPGTWGGWRLHAGQATAGADLGSAEHGRRIDEMIDHAIEGTEPWLAPAVRRGLREKWVRRSRDLREFSIALGECAGPVRRKAFLAGRVLGGSPVAWAHLARRLGGLGGLGGALPPSGGGAQVDCIRKWLESAGVPRPLVPVGDARSLPEGAQACGRAKG